jgi:hypothetical protein
MKDVELAKAPVHFCHMFLLKRVLLLGLALLSFAKAKSSIGSSLLVVVEPNRKDDFSIFFDDLRGKNLLKQVAKHTDEFKNCRTRIRVDFPWAKGRWASPG